MTWFHKFLAVLGAVFLTACAVPKYSYDREDAGTVYLSQTSTFAMWPHATAWSIAFEPMDETIRKTELPQVAVVASARIYGWERNPRIRYPIFDFEKFGDVQQTTKLPPGKYKIVSILRQEQILPRDGFADRFKQVLFNNNNVDTSSIAINFFRYHNAKAFPSTEFTVIPGKAVYLGAFNASMYDCTNRPLFNTCDKFQVVINDEFERDTKLLKTELLKKPNEPIFEPVNSALKIDQVQSPYFFSKP